MKTTSDSCCPRVVRNFRRRGERGGVSVMAMGCVVLVAVMSLLTADIGLYLWARSQAHTAADAAALAAVQESFPLFSTGAEPEEAARRFARANSAEVESLRIAPGGERVVVRTAVRPRSVLLRLLGIGAEKVTAVSAAEVDMTALLASGNIWYTPDPAALKTLMELMSGAHAKDFNGAATLVAMLSLSHLGKPYVWGADGPNAFDCSGLVCYVYAQLGIHLPRVTFSQVGCGRKVSPAELAAGDLVFFRQNAHVGIYLGGGWFIHAPRTGDVVKITALSSRSDISACRRIL
ncbi:MAG: C40 family peptidase [Candidatus Geothermincolia bacterium]